MSTEEPFPAFDDPDDVGASRRTALRPDLVLRLLVPFCAVPFVVELVHGRLAAALTAPAADTVVVALVSLGMVAGTLYASVMLWTTRVWVERAGSSIYDPKVLHSARLGRRQQAVLRPPTRLRVTGSNPYGARPSWRLVATDGEGREMLRLRTPFVPALRRVVSLIREAVPFDADLTADLRPSPHG